MKKQILVLIFLMSSIEARTNRTFLMPRSQNANELYEMFIWKKIIHSVSEDYGTHVQLTPFYQASHSSRDLSKYFLFSGKDTLKVSTAQDGDIDPVHFDLASSFNGTFGLKPRQKVYAVRFDLYQNIRRLLKDFYVGLSTTLANVANDPSLVEDGTTAITNTFKAKALSSQWAENWKFGKIDGKQSKLGLADIDFKFGYKLVNTDRLKMAAALFVTVPTGNSAKSVYVWEPILGAGDHFALGASINSNLNLYDANYKDSRWNLLGLANYRYLLSNNEVRTIELKNKSWGRYLKMRKQNPTNTTQVLAHAYPGINVLTRDVKVRPGSEFDGVLAVQYENKGWGFNLGYNVWLRENEKVSLRKAFNAPGIFGIASSNATAGLPAEAAAVAVSSSSSIKSLDLANGIFLTESDLDLIGQPAAMTNKLFVVFNFDSKWNKAEFFGSLGGSYEVAQKNNALEQWTVFGSLGMSF